MQASSFLAALPFFFAFALPASSTFATEITAGVARVDLTPPMELNASLGGYGDRMSRPPEGVQEHGQEQRKSPRSLDGESSGERATTALSAGQ